jgi:hypothetical protein
MILEIRTLTILFCCLVLLDCSSEEKKACPAGGIGLKAADGTSCSRVLVDDPNSVSAKDCTDQLEKYFDYNCSEPQVCTDRGQRPLATLTLEPNKQNQNLSATFILTNCTGGTKKLTINKVRLVGDERCSFKEPEIEKLEISADRKSNSASIRVVYQPKTIGPEDHAALQVVSDAQNFPKFVIPICGRTAAKYAPGKDSGAPTSADGGGQTLVCKDVGDKVTTSCHKE